MRNSVKLLLLFCCTIFSSLSVANANADESSLAQTLCACGNTNDNLFNSSCSSLCTTAVAATTNIISAGGAEASNNSSAVKSALAPLAPSSGSAGSSGFWSPQQAPASTSNNSTLAPIANNTAQASKPTNIYN